MSDEREIRLQRLQALREQRINPYPNAVERTHTIAETLEHFSTLEGPDGHLTLVGRIRLKRGQGKASFLKIEDGTGSIQLFFSLSDVGEEAYRTLKLVDLGDFIQASGYLFVSQRGERTLRVQQYRLLSKSIRPLQKSIMGWRTLTHGSENATWI